MNAIIISIDLLIALSIVSTSTILILLSMRNTQAYISNFSKFQNRTFGMVTVSQEISGALDSLKANESVAASVAGRIAHENGLGSYLLDPSHATICSNRSKLCRFVTISGSTNLLVIFNEDPSES